MKHKQFPELPENVRKAVIPAIYHGYISSPADYTPQWKHTFCGTFITKYGARITALNLFRDLLRRDPTWDDLTEENLHELKERVVQNYCPSTAVSVFKYYRATINARLESQDIPFRNYKRILRVKPSISEAVYLTENEIQHIYDYKPRNYIEEIVREIFLIGCYTGARFSDSAELTTSNIQQDGYLHYVTQKTQTPVTLPQHRNLPSLLHEHKHNIPQLSVFNDTLRLICQKCHITKPTTLTRRGKTTTQPKCEFVASHTARRSFATNLFLRGAEVQQIQKFMGHTFDAQTRKYIVAERRVSPQIEQFFKQ